MVRAVIAGRPLWLQVLLDATAFGIAIAIFAQAYDPDVLFHGIWVILALEAFAFGLGVTAIRIVITVAVLLAYSWLAVTSPGGLPLELVELELSEWPLMLIIISIVAIMADRVSTTGRRYAALYRQASERLLTAQEDERKHLALDLHDGVGQVLTALSLALDSATRRASSLTLERGGGPTARARRSDALRRAKELTTIALEETRGVAFRLRPARIVETGLSASIRELARASGGPITVRSDLELDRPGVLAPQMEVEVYRIVQESLGNALRHAHATIIRVEVGQRSSQLRIVVSDDGVGFDPRAIADRGLGVAGMRERALVLGASIEVESRLGHGTRVSLRVPLPSAPRRQVVEQPDVKPATP